MSCLKRLGYSFIAIIVLTLKTREIFAFFLIPLVYQHGYDLVNDG